MISLILKLGAMMVFIKAGFMFILPFIGKKKKHHCAECIDTHTRGPNVVC